MSDDIKNFREAVAKFDELQTDLESLTEDFKEVSEKNKNINNNSKEIVEQNQAVLRSINTLQINAVSVVENSLNNAKEIQKEMSDYYSSEHKERKLKLDTLLNEFEYKLSTLQSTIKTTIQKSINDVHIDTSELAKTIDNKIINYDTQKFDKFNSDVIDYFQQHRKDANKYAKEAKEENTRIKEYRISTNTELETMYQEKKEWIEKLKKQNKSYSKSLKTPKGFLGMIILGIFFGIILGTIITVFLTNKQVVVYKELNITELAKKSGEKNWIKTKVLEEAMKDKNTNTDINILTFVPWWLMLIFVSTTIMIFSPTDTEEENKLHQ